MCRLLWETITALIFLGVFMKYGEIFHMSLWEFFVLTINVILIFNYRTTDERGRTPLHVASSHGRLDLVKWLVMNDASVNELTQTGYSCMHLSSMNGHVQVMKILVALGVDVDCLTVDEQTPLHLAAMK